MSQPTTTTQAVMTGGCQCGAIRYALKARPYATLCFCRMCQKATGSPVAGFARVRGKALVWTRGQPATFQSSSAACRDFCSRCGTPLAFRFLDEPWIDVTLGTLDRPAEVPPQEIFGVEGRQPWFTAVLSGSLPETPTDLTNAGRKGVVSRQHPDHDTPEGWSP
jgi:hypothetical protein